MVECSCCTSSRSMRPESTSTVRINSHFMEMLVFPLIQNKRRYSGSVDAAGGCRRWGKIKQHTLDLVPSIL